MTLDDVATITGCCLRISGTKRDGEWDYCARLVDLEVLHNGMLTSASAGATTPEFALIVLAEMLSKKRIVVGAYTDKRQEFSLPEVKP